MQVTRVNTIMPKTNTHSVLEQFDEPAYKKQYQRYGCRQKYAFALEPDIDVFVHLCKDNDLTSNSQG